MAFFGEGGGWYRKKPFSLMSGVPQIEGTINQRRLIAPTTGVDAGLRMGQHRLQSGTPIKQLGKKKGPNWEEISEVMGEMMPMEDKFVTDQASQSGQDFTLSLMDQASPDVGNLGLAQEAFWKKKLGYA